MILSDSAVHRPTSKTQTQNDYLTWLRDQGFTHHSTSHGINGNSRVARPWTADEELHHTSYVAEMAARFFETARDPSAPWFLHVSFVAPHPPLIPPQAYWDRYAHRTDLAPVLADWAPKSPPKKGLPPDVGTGPFDPEEIRLAIAGYYGLINHIDDRVAYLLERFFEYGNDRAKEPTYILFSSDHGEMLGDHHLFRKSLPYESSAHVPLFISGKNIDIPRGTSNALCSWEDLMPTILDLAGVPIPENLDGRSLLPVLQKKSTAIHEDLHGVCTDRGHRFLLSNHHKYIWFTQTNEEQLFDLNADPNELHDLSANSNLLEPMRQKMAAYATQKNLLYNPAHLKPTNNTTPAALKFP
jgi:arylsulfatase A-like enzyme